MPYFQIFSMTFKIGSHIVYVDEYRKEHDALVTTFHGGDPETNPSINLVFVAPENGEDQYGAQKKHESSVTHCIDNTADARCWRSVDK